LGISDFVSDFWAHQISNVFDEKPHDVTEPLGTILLHSRMIDTVVAKIITHIPGVWTAVEVCCGAVRHHTHNGPPPPHSHSIASSNIPARTVLTSYQTFKTNLKPQRKIPCMNTLILQGISGRIHGLESGG